MLGSHCCANNLVRGNIENEEYIKTDIREITAISINNHPFPIWFNMVIGETQIEINLVKSIKNFQSTNVRLG